MSGNNMLKIKNLFYWLLIVGLAVKLLYVYLSVRDTFYISYVLQGFLLTVLAPTLLIGVLLSFAYSIRKKVTYYLVSLAISLVGSAVLLMGLLYYRANTHFVFFPQSISLTGISMWQEFIKKDFIFGFDFVIILIAFLVLLATGKLKAESSDEQIDLADFQKAVLALRGAISETKEQLTIQKIELEKLQEENTQLKAGEVPTSGENQAESPLTQEEHNEMVYLEAEKSNLHEGIKMWEERKKNLEQTKSRMEQKLGTSAAHLQGLAQEQKELLQEKSNLEQSIKEFEATKTDELEKLEKLKQVAQSTYDEMLGRLNQ